MKLDVFCGHTDGIPACSAYQRYIQLPHHPACPRGGFFFASALLVAPARKASGLDRSNWLRAAAFEKLNGTQPSASRDWELVKDVKTVDPRAREIIKDVLLRLERLEGAVFSTDKKDPFA